MVAADLLASCPAYEFSTEDKTWTLTLTKDFLALKTSNYLRWEDYLTHLQAPLEALLKIYDPSFFVRIGLRYQNIIDRSSLNLDCGWKDLVEPHVLGELATDSISERVEASARDVTIQLEDNEKVRVQHGLGISQKSNNEVYFIDADYHTTQRTEVKDAIATLGRFNGESGHLFRWCITKKLHNAMGPEPA